MNEKIFARKRNLETFLAKTFAKHMQPFAKFLNISKIRQSSERGENFKFSWFNNSSKSKANR